MPINATTSTAFNIILNKPTGNSDGSSSNSCDENQNSVDIECPHINKSVDLQKVRKVIVKKDHSVVFATDCEECKKTPNTETEMNGDFEYDLSLWLCLK